MQVLGDDALRLGLHPGRDEGRELAHRDAAEDKLLADQAHRVDGAPALLGKPIVGSGFEQEPIPVLPREGIELVLERPIGWRLQAGSVGCRRHVGETSWGITGCSAAMDGCWALTARASTASDTASKTASSPITAMRPARRHSASVRGCTRTSASELPLSP